jgi:hypothetical protein
MVRLVEASGAPSTLFLATRAPSGKPIIELRVDSPLWWHLDVVTVLRTPDDRFVGTQFSSVAAAMGELKKAYLPHDEMDILDQLEAYITPHETNDFNEKLLGSHSFVHTVQGSQRTARHSPRLAAVPVACSRAPTTTETGGWYSVAVIRPFAPHDMSDAGEVDQRVSELMRQVRCPLPLAPGNPRNHLRGRAPRRAGTRRAKGAETASSPASCSGPVRRRRLRRQLPSDPA